MAAPVVSVIIPFFNAENTILRAMHSIAQQSYGSLECILIDNNSTDNSQDIVTKFIQNDKRFKRIAEAKQGVMHAFNTGAAHAMGYYICRMDADDWSFPERIQNQVDFLKKNPEYDAVAGLAEHAGEMENTEGLKRYVVWSNGIITMQEIRNAMFTEMPLINPTAMWKKSSGEKFGLYRQGDFPEDYEMWLRWLEKGAKIAKIQDVVLKWYDSADRLTRTDHSYSEESFYRLKSEYLVRWLKKNNPFHPEVYVWGASKISRNRFAYLENSGISVKAFIDIKKSRQLDRKVLYYEEIPGKEKCFILVYMKLDYAKENIRKFLRNRNFVEGENFLFVS